MKTAGSSLLVLTSSI